MVGVATGTIPVALKRMMEVGFGTSLLCGANKEVVAGNTGPISHGNTHTLAGPKLELPLRRHDLVDTTDPNGDTGIEAGR
jgi:hypothetical protein